MAEDKFKIKNYGNYFYRPPENMISGLKEIIIFNENSKKHNIPNGSVWVYDALTGYNPDILKSDVGCGITAFITEKIDFDKKTRFDILKAVHQIKLNIGQGNHFIDFTIGHPSSDSEQEHNMIYLHSDFNSEKKTPLTFQDAKTIENEATEKRCSYIEKLSKILGIRSEFYNNWTHNSVNLENENFVYRKGSINLKDTDYVGALALNPIDGIYLYVMCSKKNHGSMQHGVGRKNSKSELMKHLVKEKFGISRGYSVCTTEIDKKIHDAVNRSYNSQEEFIKNFHNLESMIGYCTTEYVVKTKLS